MKDLQKEAKDFIKQRQIVFSDLNMFSVDEVVEFLVEFGEIKFEEGKNETSKTNDCQRDREKDQVFWR